MQNQHANCRVMDALSLNIYVFSACFEKRTPPVLKWHVCYNMTMFGQYNYEEVYFSLVLVFLDGICYHADLRSQVHDEVCAIPADTRMPRVTWTDKKLLDVIVPGIELLDHSHLKLLRGKVYFCQFIQFFEIKACGFKHEGKHFLMLLRADTDMVHVFFKPCPEHSPPQAKEFALQYEVSHD